MEWRFTDGYEVNEFAKTITADDDYALKAEEKQLFVNAVFSSAKTLTLGIPAGQNMILANLGSITFTAKNVSGDSGQSVAGNKVYLVYGGAEANETKFIALA